MDFDSPTHYGRRLRAVALCALTTALAGCAGNALPALDAASLGASGNAGIGLTTGALANLATAAIPELPQLDSDPVGPPTELYARIARGAQNCWFGGNGPLKSRYIFHADAAPPSKGGQAEIIIHEIDRSTPNPRGARAFRVTVTPSGETSTVQSENSRFTPEVAQVMSADVRRWARNDLTCLAKGKVEGWSPNSDLTPIPTSPSAPTKKQPKTQRET